MPNQKITYQDLEKELNTLKSELNAQKEATYEARKQRLRFVGRATNFFLGTQLTTELKNIKKKVGNLEKPTADDWIDLSGAIFYRITRIGVITILLGLLPTMMLVIQSVQLSNQNTLFKAQNERISQQTYLQEADRRSSLVFLFSNVMDAIDRELTTDYGNDSIRNLSPQLVGRIISLSQSLKPYHYLDGDTLISKPLSPERGQLLINLVESDLDSLTYEKIYERGIFKQSFLQGANLEDANISNINLEHSDLQNANLRNAILKDANLQNVNFENAVLWKTELSHSDLRNANLKSVNLIAAKLNYTNLKNANLSNAVLWEADSEYADLTMANLTMARLEGANFRKVELYQANLTKARINNTDLSGANFTEANFTGIKLTGLGMKGVDLSTIRDNIEGQDSFFKKYKEFLINENDSTKQLIIASDTPSTKYHVFASNSENNILKVNFENEFHGHLVILTGVVRRIQGQHAGNGQLLNGYSLYFQPSLVIEDGVLSIKEVQLVNNNDELLEKSINKEVTIMGSLSHTINSNYLTDFRLDIIDIK